MLQFTSEEQSRYIRIALAVLLGGVVLAFFIPVFFGFKNATSLRSIGTQYTLMTWGWLLITAALGGMSRLFNTYEVRKNVTWAAGAAGVFTFFLLVAGNADVSFFRMFAKLWFNVFGLKAGVALAYCVMLACLAVIGRKLMIVYRTTSIRGMVLVSWGFCALAMALALMAIVIYKFAHSVSEGVVFDKSNVHALRAIVKWTLYIATGVVTAGALISAIVPGEEWDQVDDEEVDQDEDTSLMTPVRRSDVQTMMNRDEDDTQLVGAVTAEASSPVQEVQEVSKPFNIMSWFTTQRVLLLLAVTGFIVALFYPCFMQRGIDVFWTGFPSQATMKHFSTPFYVGMLISAVSMGVMAMSCRDSYNRKKFIHISVLGGILLVLGFVFITGATGNNILSKLVRPLMNISSHRGWALPSLIAAGIFVDMGLTLQRLNHFTNLKVNIVSIGYYVLAGALALFSIGYLTVSGDMLQMGDNLWCGAVLLALAGWVYMTFAPFDEMENPEEAESEE